MFIALFFLVFIVISLTFFAVINVTIWLHQQHIAKQECVALQEALNAVYPEKNFMVNVSDVRFKPNFQFAQKNKKFFLKNTEENLEFTSIKEIWTHFKNIEAKKNKEEIEKLKKEAEEAKKAIMGNSKEEIIKNFLYEHFTKLDKLPPPS